MINVVPCTNRNCAAQNTDLGPERIPVFSEMLETAQEGQNNILIVNPLQSIYCFQKNSDGN